MPVKRQVGKSTSGLAIASLILGITSFMPLIGVILGITAIILGIVSVIRIRRNGTGGRKLAIAGIILGIFGIAFTIVLYGSLFYFGFVAKNGPFVEVRKQASQQILTQNAGYLELYKKQHGKYPASLDELMKEGSYMVFPTDHYMKPLHYEVTEGGNSYNLRSLGPDGEYGTADDIFPKIQ
jgi:hypothetical protein